MVDKSVGAEEYTDCTSAEEEDLPNECTGYYTKHSDGEVPVMMEFGGMRSTPSLPSLPDLLWVGIVELDSFLSIGQIELNCVLILN